ncbi:MAG: protein-disulfide isomerase [Nitrosopumilaceae archaeon]
MGKKIKEERVEKRERLSEKISREKRRFKLIAISIIAAVAVILAITGYMFYENTFKGQMNTPGAPPGAGILGGEHEHAAIDVVIFDDRFDFSSPAYQVKSPYIHFEANNGETIHRHAANVTLGYLFDTLKIGLTDSCYTFPDKSREFCTDNTYGLRFFVNHEPKQSLRDYVVKQGDRILVSYGTDNSTRINDELARIDSILIDIR